MLNDRLPTLEDKGFAEMLKLEDGDTVTGNILMGERIQTKFGEAFKFTLLVEGKEKIFVTSSNFLAGKLNQFNPNDVITIERTGVGTETRWHVFLEE